jgi:hypothetical protein
MVFLSGTTTFPICLELISHLKDIIFRIEIEMTFIGWNSSSCCPTGESSNDSYVSGCKALCW